MQSAREGLLKIVADALRRAPAAEVPFLAWPLVCGVTVAERTQATAFKDGILSVNVPDETWCAQLQSMAPQYLLGLERMIGKHVERIEFVAISGKKR
jgi:predicted nucleic acid-binding Zn ribbon protein